MLMADKKLRPVLVSAALLAASAAQAQNTPAATEQTNTQVAQAATSAAPVLEEIVVTADRRNSYSADLVQAGSFRGARQLDTPLTISVITDEMLKSQQAQGLLDALRNTAGVSTSQTSQNVYNNLAIRGILVENRGNYRLNGVMPIINLIDLPMEDKDRVEALKGASALYYGFSAPSGIINLTMKRPTEEFMGTASLFGNNHGAIGTHVDVGGTYGKVGGRVNVVFANPDSGIDNAKGRRSLLAGAFDFKPTDDLTISIDGERIYKNVNEPGVFRITTLPASTVANPYPAVALPPLTDPKINFGPDWAANVAREHNLVGHVDYDINEAWNVTLDAGISQMYRIRRFNTLNPTNLTTGEGVMAISMQRAEYKNKNFRGQINGTFATGPLVHEVMLGASQNVRDQFSPTSVAVTCPGATPTSPRVSCTQNFLTPRFIPETAFPASFTANTTRINDIGYYAFDRIKVTEWLQLLGGLRYSDYTESVVNTGAITFADKPTSLSGGAVIKPTEWISVYGTYIEGLETTPAAPQTATNAGAVLPATSSTQYEGGIKIEPIKSLLFQAAYFDISRGSNYVNAANTYVQDGRASYKGFEFSLTGEVMPELSVYASALFLKAKQASGAPSRTVGTTFTPTAVGLRIENTPRRTFSLATEYRFLDMLPGFSMTGAVYYVGNRAVNPLNQAFIPSYTLFDLGAAYSVEIAGHETTFRINGQNVGGKRYFDGTGGFIISKGQPGQVKFSVTSAF